MSIDCINIDLVPRRYKYIYRLTSHLVEARASYAQYTLIKEEVVDYLV
jgi:hypothetical protein